MVGPLNKEELPARQSLEPAPRTRLRHSMGDLMPSQQSPIIGVVEYLAPSDTIQCNIDAV